MQVSNFNFQCDLSPVLLWQYLEAENLKSLVDFQQVFMNTAVDDFIKEFDKSFLNISTASTNGLALWGRLLNVGRPVYEKDGNIVEFTDEQYRVVLRAQIYLLVFDGSAKALNHFLKILFPNLPIVIVDNYDMTVSINILKNEDEISEEEKVLLDYLFKPYSATGGLDTYSLSLPRPSGVKYIMNYNIDYSKTFGFYGQTYTTEQDEQERMPGFDNGTFIA